MLQFLVPRIRDLEFLVTDTEKEALILENTLIKEHRSRYNIDLRDDKTYFSLRMDLGEEFPRLTVIRRVKPDGARALVLVPEPGTRALLSVAGIVAAAAAWRRRVSVAGR